MFSRTASFCIFFFNDTATTEIYTLSLHDALPISLPRGGFEYAANDFDRGALPGPEGLSEPRDPGPLRALSDNEIVRGPRSIARNFIHQVNKRGLLSGLPVLCKPQIHELTACIQRTEGVQGGRELRELRRDYDSTGLRAAP